MKDRCIVSAAIGAKYRTEFQSMRWHVEKHCSDDHDIIHWDDYPPGCPTQQQRQYAFKIYAIADAIQRGYRRVLWMDIVYMPQGSIDALWAVVARQGWYIPTQGDAVLGNWCSDACLEVFGLSRDEAMTVPLCYSGLVGLDLDHRTGQHIWELWQLAYERGAFQGPHKNEGKPGEPIHAWGHKTAGHCSDDPRCMGHRQDESALSAILYRLNLKPETAGVLGDCIKMHVRKPSANF